MKGSNPSYYFQQLSLDKGLSQTTVNTILADNKGLIWIGTASGLNCFDRYDMKSYFHEKDNPHSLPGNTIYFITEDSLNNIWISTNNGLTLYEKSSDSFLPVEYEGKIISVNSFHLVEGAILFSTNGGLYIYDYKEKAFVRSLSYKPIPRRSILFICSSGMKTSCCWFRPMPGHCDTTSSPEPSPLRTIRFRQT
ncbi:MAG: hypothetical protein LUH01_05240 [Parabacteroides gordonii]|nr:hypothetical protein [Parabacteroides gordonii]